MDSGFDYWAAKAALDWQIELGADEAIGDAPVDRYALDAARAKPTAPVAAPNAVPVPAAPDDPVAEARRLAAGARDLGGLAAAMEGFEHCALKAGARSFVFCDGNPDARLMIVGEAPGREEDRAGRPFVGRAGQLLDRMLAAIGMARAAPDAAHAVYITNVLPWRPPENRRPERAEIAMFLPFLEAHIALARPEVLVLMGNTPCDALLGRSGITRMRGSWTEVLGVPALPMFHPAFLLRQPQAKREAWADLLDVQARLRGRG
ncbi:uracil-DNA glycosylase [Oceanicola granulosus HTCC2516]|uniref:Type-4 uracil-DNA glycosylase n=1 Tax=Oceanicola granulosus (strain ATCC BAA-861 / DSM 15982 / KCTC 12143 / HTCC2516) TaxID=314256 RepID=Q2CB79_OCEGH|nr:uracil-DNA glycosylase [Oceanicola granulosus]EAR49906.1 uracil-DNA glycosylase [Oceanicola granulosus HTCC2516]